MVSCKKMTAGTPAVKFSCHSYVCNGSAFVTQASELIEDFLIDIVVETGMARVMGMVKGAEPIFSC